MALSRRGKLYVALAYANATRCRASGNPVPSTISAPRGAPSTSGERTRALLACRLSILRKTAPLCKSAMLAWFSPITNGDLKWSETSAVASVVTYASGSFTPTSYRPGVATMRHGAHAMANITSGSESQNRYSRARASAVVSTPGNRHAAKPRSSVFHTMAPPARSSSRSLIRLRRMLPQKTSTPTTTGDEARAVGKVSSAARRSA